MTRCVPLLAVALVATLAIAAGGRQKPSAPPSGSDGAAKPEPWSLAFTTLVHNDRSGRGEANGVTATSPEGTVIKADTFKWDKAKRTAHGDGNLSMADPQADATANAVDIDYARERRVAVLTGSVSIQLKPKSEGKAASGDAADDDVASARRYPVAVTCDRVEYQYAREVKHAVLSGSFRAVQKLSDRTRTLVAVSADWYGPEERIVLHGPVKLEDSKGQSFESELDVEVDAREGSEGLRMSKGKGVITLDDDQDRAEPAKPPAKPDGAPPARPAANPSSQPVVRPAAPPSAKP